MRRVELRGLSGGGIPANGVAGWAGGIGARLNQSIAVRLYEGSTSVASVKLRLRSVPCRRPFSETNGAHGFSIPIPSAGVNGVPHTYEVRYETSATALGQPFYSDLRFHAPDLRESTRVRAASNAITRG